MPPVAKSKSKDKKSGKEAQKVSSKSAVSSNGNGSVAANPYNTLLGTFEALDSVSVASVSQQDYGCFGGSKDEVDVNGVECDSISNNSSCSGDSEDHNEKPTNLPLKQEMIPGADNEKQEKVRQNNGRKHQRQRERRAKELYDKCRAYLMSRKLEALTQKLVAMGISQEHATTALLMNEGKVEESVHWLFDRGEEEIKEQSTQNLGNLKIDIAGDLDRITQMELQFKCSRQEIERSVVQAEGDLDRAEEVMKRTKLEELQVPAKQEESSDPLISNNGKHFAGKGYPNFDAESSETRDEKSFNHLKSTSSTEPMSKVAQLKDLPKPLQYDVLADKRWPNTEHNTSASYSLPPQSASRVEARYIASGNEFQNLQHQQPTNKEPFILMRQQPQVLSTNPVPTMSTFEIMRSSELNKTHNIPTAGPNNQQLQYQDQMRFSNYYQVDPHGSHIVRGNGGLRTRSTSSSPSIAVASSLGLFSPVGTSGTSSHIDWSSSDSVDLSSIDWSVDQSLSQNTGLSGAMDSYSLRDPMGWK